MLTGRAGLRCLTIIVAVLGPCCLLPDRVGAETLTLSPANAFNPIGTDHTLTATITPATQGAKAFFQVGGACSGGIDDGEPCSPGGTACTACGGTRDGPAQGAGF